MNPLDFIPRAVWVALVGMLVVTSCKLKMDNTGLAIENEKGKTYVAQLKTAISESNARAKTQSLNFESQARKAEQDSARRERVLADNGRANLRELDGLRAAASTYALRPKLAANPLAPQLDVADIFPELFLQCSSRLVQVAGEADQWKSDAIKLSDAWPKLLK